MNKPNATKTYHDLLEDILKNGNEKNDRTETGTLSVYGRQVRFNMKDGFPLLTTKKLHLRSITHELLWFLNGETNIRYLNDNNVTIWDEWSQNVGNFPNESRLNGWIKIRNNNTKVSYSGNYSTKGISVKKDSIDDKLRSSWVKMMKRCYDSNSHNYQMYGDKGIFVDERWHDVSNFISDVKELQNWNLKQSNWNNFELDKDYYGSNCYSKETCVWLDIKENNIYIGKPIQITDDNGTTIYHSYTDAENKLGVSRSTLHRWVKQGNPKMFKGKNKQFAKSEVFEVSEVEKEGFVYRKLFTNGELGPVYGQQWIDWGGSYEKLLTRKKDENGFYKFATKHHPGINQIQNVIDRLKEAPDCRRMIVSAWNVGELDKMALMPCHNFFQVYTRELSLEERSLLLDKKIGQTKENRLLPYLSEMFETHNIPTREISLMWNQRSVDTFLGLPFNIASYAMLLHMFAQQVNMVPGELIGNLGDVHIYNNHITYVEEQLGRDVYKYKQPELSLNKGKDMFSYKFDDFKILNYESYPNWRGVPIAV